MEEAGLISIDLKEALAYAFFMPTKDSNLFAIIERLGEHYRNNINNRYVKDALSRIPLDRTDREKINSLTEMPDYIKMQGIEYTDLYEKILAMARFIKMAQSDVVPTLSPGGGSMSASSQEDILRNMAVGNFGSNLGILRDITNELYVKAAELDQEEHSTSQPVYKRMAEMREIGNLLVDG